MIIVNEQLVEVLCHKEAYSVNAPPHIQGILRNQRYHLLINMECTTLARKCLSFES